MCIAAAERAHQQLDSDAALHHLDVADELYVGEYLEEDVYLDWPRPTRERLRQLRLQHLRLAAAIHESRDDPARALELYGAGPRNRRLF